MHRLIKELNDFQQDFAARAKAAIADEFKVFFAEYPSITSINWTQYTPYFNDGEPCEFGTHDLKFHVSPEFLETFGEDVKASYLKNNEGEDDGYYDILYSIDDITASWSRHPERRAMTNVERALKNRCTELNSLVQGLGDHMKLIFGDHVMIRATATGFDVSDYDHD